MKQIIWIGLIVIALIVGLFFGSIMLNKTQIENKYNHQSFVVDATNEKMVSVSTSDCIEEYERRYSYNCFEDCELTRASTQVGNSMLREYGCSCWCEG